MLREHENNQPLELFSMSPADMCPFQFTLLTDEDQTINNERVLLSTVF